MIRAMVLLLACFSGTLLHGQDIVLPSTITAKGKLVIISPEFKTTPKAVDFTVLGVKEVPEYASLGNAVLVAEPDAGDEYTVIIFAVFDGYKTAKAVTVVKPRSSTDNPTNEGTTPTAPAGDRDIPAGVTNLHAVLIVDVTKEVPADITALSNGPNTVTKALSQRNSFFYVRAHTDSLAQRFAKETTGKQYPVLVILDARSGVAKVVNAVSIKPTGDAERTAKQIITAIAVAIPK